LTNNALKSFINKEWTFLQASPQPVEILQAALHISAPLAKILVQRGLVSPEKAQEFLAPSLSQLPQPWIMQGMREAVELIFQAITEKRSIVVYGDYDVDGVTATAVLILFLSEIGVKCHSCHPNRFTHGYGLKADLVNETLIDDQPPGLLITVDCGISDVLEVQNLVRSGWQVIITDHHQPPEPLPPAHVILNPWQKGCQFPSKDLAGVGVSFYLAMGIRNHLHQMGYWPANVTPPNLKKLLDLVAIGTISDMVPLRGVNRVLTKAGLEVLAHTENPGLRELLSLCHCPVGQPPNTEDIAFQLGPRLNAAGRMGDAKRASLLLSSDDQHLVKYLADIIQQENIARRDLTSQFVVEARGVIEAQNQLDNSCLIIHGHNWHLGLLGIIASRLVDQFAKPVFVFSGTDTLKGSARSIPGINIHESLAACADEILTFGGHSSAAGLSLKEANLSTFRERINQAIQRQLTDKAIKIPLNIALVISPQTAFTDLEALGDQLAPFGQENPEPIFTTEEPCRLRNMSVIGKERNHLRFLVSWDGMKGRWLDGIGFGFAKMVEQSVNGEARLRLAFSLKKNYFNGQNKTQVTLHDALIPSAD